MSDDTTSINSNILTREDVFLKKAAKERQNLINLTKLIVNDLISSSLKAGRTIDDNPPNAIHIENYFSLIDRVLKHGLKSNLLSNGTASLWFALDNLSKYLKESTLMSESVRSLQNTKTYDGKVRAWMRLAMMQKKMPEYFNELLTNKDVLLKNIYHDYAFMLSDEAHVFAGLLIGVNVIDCNFFVKDANFDVMVDIIDLSPYLRAPNSGGQNEEIDAKQLGAEIDGEQRPDFKAILDQKSYLEERNKKLEDTISDLQSKIKSLEDQHSKYEVEAKINAVQIQKLRDQKMSNITEKSAPQSISSSLTSGTLPMMGGVFSKIIQKSKEFTESTKLSLDTEQGSDQAKLSIDIVETSDRLPNDKQNNNNNLQQQASDDMTGDHVSSEGSESIVVVEAPSQQEMANSMMETASIKTQSSRASVGRTSQVSKGQSKEELDPIEFEAKKKLLEEQGKELAVLKERAGILESSYRSSLARIRTLERDLDIQTSMNVDKDNTIKIYERDIKEKQAQVESLRNSLNDAKKLNADLSERFNETSTKLKERVKSVSNLQASLDKWKLENKTLAARLQEKQTSLASMKAELDKALTNVVELKKYNEKVNDELKRERESGRTSTVTLETQNARIADLTSRIEESERELKNLKSYKERSEELTKRCQEYEQSLEEIGIQLRESRLEVENLKENSAVFLDSQWMDSKQVKSCTLCEQGFSVTRRKHHCRLCGNVFCQSCSDNKMELASSSKPARVCDTCHSFLLAKFVKQSSNST